MNPAPSKAALREAVDRAILGVLNSAWPSPVRDATIATLRAWLDSGLTEEPVCRVCHGTGRFQPAGEDPDECGVCDGTGISPGLTDEDAEAVRKVRDGLGAEFETYCDVRMAGQSDYDFQMTRLNEWRAALDAVLERHTL